ncbi:uncharacterized protein MKK02DRAFT_32836 [Dioszegia hungarica]|uniref:RNA polymerase II elongation factor ELL N-terminal domain-containing protein n=1 Tax=Dioszegia hungarica TaxID=4972 RepID=A0AA38H9L2_9TREE|nr:uncharacterized protein MKK02DRAFT_32836 [Dioszegia hungarica]KAI9635404.1 hypothetical protein MKK02DRAFT_32836 [Dioszegia hungarica]
MALPDKPLPLGTSTQAGKPAFLVKFPQDVWERIVSGGTGSVQIVKNDAKLSLILPDRTIGLDANPLVPTELYELSDTLLPLGTASTRLSIPFTTASSSKAIAEAIPERRPVNGNGNGNAHGAAAKLRREAATPLARSLSSPAGPAAPVAPTTPVIPLKTRVVQYLALGPASVEEILSKLGGAEADVMRVVKVVGRQVAENPPRYSLQPSQYAKIKIGAWRYTPEEQEQVGQMAREAFDELEYPEGSEERVELERKLEEAANMPPVEEVVAAPAVAPVQAAPSVPVPAPAPSTASQPDRTPVVTPSSSKSRPSASTSTSAASSSSKNKGPVAREMAKFRAEQARATSAPGLKGTNGNASPREAAAALSAADAVKTKKRAAGAKADKGNTAETSRKAEKAERSDTSSRSDEKGSGKKRKRGRHPSPSFTSSEDEDEEDSRRGRAKQRNRPAPKSTLPKLPPPDAATLAAMDALPPSRPIANFTKRKSPPQPLDLHSPTQQTKSRTPSTTASELERPDDPEDLRDRYEELYPAYQILTTKLIGLHRAAEGVELGEADIEMLPTKEEMEKLVKKWERWHKELAGIRRWFGAA